MHWAERPEDSTAEQQEVRTCEQMVRFNLHEEFNLLGIEIATGKPVIWCGFHDIDWTAGRCDTGFWVRKAAQGRWFATESTNALLRYAFSALGMRRVGISHSRGNEASRRVVEKLGFTPEGVQQGANSLPGGQKADRYLCARLDIAGLAPLDVEWGGGQICGAELHPRTELRSIELLNLAVLTSAVGKLRLVPVWYPEEGHGFRDPAHIRDREAREVAWFAENMPTK